MPEIQDIIIPEEPEEPQITVDITKSITENLLGFTGAPAGGYTIPGWGSMSPGGYSVPGQAQQQFPGFRQPPGVSGSPWQRVLEPGFANLLDPARYSLKGAGQGGSWMPVPGMLDHLREGGQLINPLWFLSQKQPKFISDLFGQGEDDSKRSWWGGGGYGGYGGYGGGGYSSYKTPRWFQDMIMWRI